VDGVEGVVVVMNKAESRSISCSLRMSTGLGILVAGFLVVLGFSPRSRPLGGSFRSQTI
jgi:hypothetical protein